MFCLYPQVLGGEMIPLPTRSRAVANSARFPRRTGGGRKGGRCGDFGLWVMTSGRKERGWEGARVGEWVEYSFEPARRGRVRPRTRGLDTGKNACTTQRHRQ